MKAILILDMPEDCCQCPYMKSIDVIPTNYWYCTADPHNLISLSERLERREEWCPLKLMPNKIPMALDREPTEAEWRVWRKGWNDCLDVITGETE